MKYRKKPVAIEATQWFKNGDHPDDGPADSEGKVVRYYRHPDVPGDSVHAALPNTGRPNCLVRMHDHGWIDTIEGGHTVCPADYVITGVEGERYPCEPRIFVKTYDAEATPCPISLSDCEQQCPSARCAAIEEDCS